jgi:hypothetical protein
MGGYIVAVGLLTGFVAQTSFCERQKGSFAIVLISGLSSIGLMITVNFIIGSDFKLALLAMSLPWIMALLLYLNHR